MAKEKKADIDGILNEVIDVTIDEVIDETIDEILEEKTREMVDHPHQRPVPKDVYMEAGAKALENNGRPQNKSSLHFDGYTFTWRTVAYPHIPSIKSYELRIERDGLVFFEKELKIFTYLKKPTQEVFEVTLENELEESTFPKRPVPEKVFIETKPRFTERNGRQAAEISVQFDGYKGTWAPAAFPHKPTVMSYDLTITRDGQSFHRLNYKMFGY